MDQDLLIPKQQPNTFLTRRNILIIFGLIILAELIWTGSTFLKQSQSGIQRQASVLSPTTVSLTTPVTNIKVGSKVTVNIALSSTKMTNGVDLIINYDPRILSVEQNSSGQAVTTGAIFTDYPQNILDAKSGRISVSGISSSAKGVVANGNFGSIVFVAIAPGQSKISIDYAPGSTTKSNVAAGGKNILDKVNNLQLNITP